MQPIEIEACLDSMIIQVDTREQPSERAEKRLKSFSHPYSREKLSYGDYSAKFKLLDGSEQQLPVAIERKMSLEELSGCFTHNRKRFAAEFERAKADNADMYLLVENANWENLINGKYQTRLNSTAFFASITAFMARYHIKIIFCKSETSAKLMEQILYRELKERLEQGVYG